MGYPGTAATPTPLKGSKAGPPAGPGRVAAFFDVDHTLVRPGSMERILVSCLIKSGYLTTADLGRYLFYLARNFSELGQGLMRSNKHHLKYKDPEELGDLARHCFQNQILPRVSPTGRRAVEEHQRQGHLVVLLTGTLKPLAELLREELDADMALAAPLGVDRGSLDGTLAAPRPYGPEKARLVRLVAREQQIDLSRSYAYGDHHSDLEVLSCVGFPMAVNPTVALRQQARRRGWPILKF